MQQIEEMKTKKINEMKNEKIKCIKWNKIQKLQENTTRWEKIQQHDRKYKQLNEFEKMIEFEEQRKNTQKCKN